MSMRIYLVRHGQKQEGQNRFSRGQYDPHLTSLGEQQADLAGRRLAGLPLQAIFCSDLARTVQTAEIINRHLGLPLLRRPELREIHMGDWEGVALEKLAEEQDACFLAWQEHTQDLPYPNGESGADVLSRMLSLLAEISKQDMQDVLLVTHGGVIRVLASAAIQLAMEKRFLLQVDHCSLTTLEYNDPSGCRLICLNDTAHLPFPDFDRE
jgi:broad specificity phosphatase PhoE